MQLPKIQNLENRIISRSKNLPMQYSKITNSQNSQIPQVTKAQMTNPTNDESHKSPNPKIIQKTYKRNSK